MKFNKILYISGLMISTQLIAATVENNQIMPPPGPYKSIMNNTPPAFVPYGSQQAQANPYQQGRTAQAFNRFPVTNQTFHKPANQPPEWVLNKQQENKEKIEKMLKENEEKNKENEKRFTEYLEKAEALSIKRNEESKKWMAENNKKMKEYWQSELDKFAKNQKLQIEKAKDLPEWVRKDMLEQQQRQLAVMKNNPPMPMQNSMQRGSQTTNGFNNMRQMPINNRFQQGPVMQQRPVMNQDYSVKPNMNRPFVQQPGQAPVMPQQRTQSFYNAPNVNRQFAPVPRQQSYPGFINGQPNVNPYNRYPR